MKVAYLLGTFPVTGKASHIQIRAVSRAFSSLGHSVKWFVRGISRQTLQDSELYTEAYWLIENVKYSGLPSRRVRHAVEILVSAVKAGIWGAEVAYCRDSPVVGLIARMLGMRVIIELHNPNMEGFSRIALRKCCNSRGVVVATVSEQLREIVARNLGISGECVAVAHDAVDGALVDLGRRKPINVSDLEGDKVKVGYVGSLDAGRGILNLVQACEVIEWAQLFIAGTGSIGLSEMFAGKPADISLLGEVDHSDISDLLTDMHIVVAPYSASVAVSGGRQTGRYMSPLKIFEYMGAGRVIVATGLPSISEILVHKENAVLISEPTVESITRALSWIRGNPEASASIASKALKDASQCTWKKRQRFLLECFLSEQSEDRVWPALN